MRQKSLLFFDSQARFVETWDEDDALTQSMGAYWTNFAKTGDPQRGRPAAMARL